MMRKIAPNARALRHPSCPASFACWILLALMTVISLPAYAAQAVATVSKTRVAVNEVFQLTISIDDSVSANALDLSVLDKDFHAGSPATSSRTSMINGVVTRQTEWRIALATKAEGQFTIPSFRIGATSTDPIVITSEQSSTQPLVEPDITISTEIDKQQLYLGESIRYTVRLMIGEQMSQATLVPPAGDGLEVKQIGEDRQAEPVLNGRRYLSITREYQITAHEPGQHQLQGAEFRGNVLKQGRGYGSTLRVPVEKQAGDITLDVKDIPPGYTGLWLPTEDLQLTQQWQPESDEIRVGDPITRLITLKMKHTEQSKMPNLSLDYPGSVKVYNEKPVYSTVNGYTLMTLKQVIIPREQGNLNLPSLTVNWWNTTTSQQETSQLNGLTLSVLPGDPLNNLALPQDKSTLGQPAFQVTHPAPEIINDTGWWPWLTALFAALWLLSTGLWLNARFGDKKNATPSARPVSGPTPLEGMRRAVQANHPIQAQMYYQQWRRHQGEHPLREQLEQAVNQMLAAHYQKPSDAGPADWSNHTLLSLIDSINQQRPKQKTQPKHHSVLEPLVPER
ncbi:BatD family protein [Photobacterium atrarenae]|uniref:BatD family protein n=1 Tax=Photobacterium atrarenae TaxID=865757 RepID=A0ABY5GNH0_9GAMM|nr:BatD family protein [Photobacterium atrarenae]UTV30355.1 BatD family protein [Photobacterium atrarenae]